jgi:hypothetical protein
MILDVLKSPRVATVVLGCGADEGGIYAVMESYLRETVLIKYAHFIDLTRKVGILSKDGFVHCDLRRPNIRFLDDGTVTLIDFKWAGKVGVAKFPPNVNKKVFGNRARQLIQDGRVICREFDWACLADLLDQINCENAATFAGNGMECEVIQSLEAYMEDDEVAVKLFRKLTPGPGAPILFDLHCLGGKLELFYLNRRSAKTGAR